MSMKWGLYNLLFLLIYPFLLPGFLFRMFRRGGYAARIGDRFALYPESVMSVFRRMRNVPQSERFVWIHAVSVGEVQVAGQLMREWRKVEPEVRFCFSTTSSTGWKMAEKEISENDVLIYNPLDFPNFVKSALRTVNPRAVILTESEIWPNFILKARKYKIPLFLINARISDRSAPRYVKGKWFFGDIFRSFSRIFAQSGLDAERICAVMRNRDSGSDVGRNVEITGSFKFDVAKRNEAKERELSKWLFDGQVERSPDIRILLGGSTWPGEDDVLLNIYSNLSKRYPGLRLVIAPRHFEKADAVEANIVRHGFSCVRRSRGECGNAVKEPAVLLADTTGELMGLYGISDVVFIGKSLCAHGSQNMIEPCLCGKPTLVGPYTENFRPVMSDLLENKAIVQVPDEASLVKTIDELLSVSYGVGKPSAMIEGLGKRAELAVMRRKGVVAKCVNAIRASLVCFVMALILFGCSDKGNDENVNRNDYVFEPIRMASAYIPIIEKPDARNALLIGTEARSLTNYFGNAGIRCSFSREGRFDIIVVACDSMSESSRHEIGKSLTDNGVLVWLIDVRGKSMGEFRRNLESFGCEEVHVWMPGHDRWVLAGRNHMRTIKISAMLDVFSREGAFDDFSIGGCGTLHEMFANYVGVRDDLMPAFDANPKKAEVRPEYFVTKEIPAIRWVVQDDGIDEDIAKSVFSEIRSMQVVRRLVIEGNMKSELAKDKKGEEIATEIWARACKRNHNDLFLLERLDRLERNAKGFLAVGKVLLAMKCYETMVLVRPDDAAAVHNFGMCLKKIGKLDLAEKVLERARTLESSGRQH